MWPEWNRTLLSITGASVSRCNDTSVTKTWKKVPQVCINYSLVGSADAFLIYLKFAGVSAIQQSLLVLCRHFRPPARSIWASRAQTMMGMHGLMGTVVATSLHCAFLKKTYCLKLSYVHRDIKIRQKCQGWSNPRVNPTISVQTLSGETWSTTWIIQEDKDEPSIPSERRVARGDELKRF